jgi:hypothetical protein
MLYFIWYMEGPQSIDFDISFSYLSPGGHMNEMPEECQNEPSIRDVMIIMQSASHDAENKHNIYLKLKW